MEMPTAEVRGHVQAMALILFCLSGTLAPGMATAAVDWNLWRARMDTGWGAWMPPPPEDHAGKTGRVLVISVGYTEARASGTQAPPTSTAAPGPGAPGTIHPPP